MESNPNKFLENRILNLIDSNNINYNINKLTIKKLLEILKLCLNKEFKKDYGFPTNESHEDLNFSIPYSHVNNPIKNSKFSNIDINFIFTILTYFKSEIRMYDIKNMLQIIKKKINTFKIILTDEMYLEIIKPYDKMIDLEILKDFLNESKDKDDESYNKIEEKCYDKFNGLDDFEKYNIKYFYLKKEILKKLNISPEYFNCSFIDIMCNEFCEKKNRIFRNC